MTEMNVFVVVDTMFPFLFLPTLIHCITYLLFQPSQSIECELVVVNTTVLFPSSIQINSIQSPAMNIKERGERRLNTTKQNPPPPHLTHSIASHRIAIKVALPRQGTLDPYAPNRYKSNHKPALSSPLLSSPPLYSISEFSKDGFKTPTITTITIIM